MIEIHIMNGTKAYQPSIIEGITLESSRKGEPGSLKFSCIQDDILKITEGNPVKMLVDGKKMFFGFIFQIKRDKSKKLQITAYDQLRYFKNKDSYIYTNMRADQVINMIASDYYLEVGSLANTGYVIASKAEDNKTLFDIVNDAIDDTLMNTTRLYVLYDDYGKLTLKDTEDMLLDLLIDSETGQSYDYTSSINDQTYNQVKLAYDNKETGKREVFIAKDTKNINNWGVLQYFEKLQSPQGASAKADALLRLYNAKTRNLKISGAFGDTRVRAGCSVVVKLDLGDVSIQNFMLVEKVKHTFNNDLHTMDLTLRGGEFVA
ncbi:MAG: hydrolase [Lachnospiraceae bacterium]